MRALMSAERKNLFSFMHDYPAPLEDDGNRYFDYDHVPDRLSCEGWRGAERFALADVEPADWHPSQRWMKHLYLHFLDSLDAVRSPARRSYDRGSPWARAQREYNESIGVVSPIRALRSGWTQRASPWLGATSYRIPPPRVLFVVLRDVDQSRAGEVNAYLDEEWVPELLDCPGFLHCERYEAGVSLSSTPGSVDVGQPQYMDIFDVASAEVPSSDAYRVLQSTPSFRGKRLAQWTTVRGGGVYLQRSSPWLIEAWDPHL
jgi:hypothetical protein